MYHIAVAEYCSSTFFWSITSSFTPLPYLRQEEDWESQRSVGGKWEWEWKTVLTSALKFRSSQLWLRRSYLYSPYGEVSFWPGYVKQDVYNVWTVSATFQQSISSCKNRRHKPERLTLEYKSFWLWQNKKILTDAQLTHILKNFQPHPSFLLTGCSLLSCHGDNTLSFFEIILLLWWLQRVSLSICLE